LTARLRAAQYVPLAAPTPRHVVMSCRVVCPSTLRARLAGAALAAAVALVTLAAQPATAVSAPIRGYDASRDAAADIERALATATATGRRVLLIVGGDWCRDCRELDAMFAADASLAALRDRHYVTVKVFVGTENRNERVLARYPKLSWVPTLIELERNGRVRRVVPSTEFHEAERLVPARVRAFLAG
jgi:thiol:disulfide interchange protein